MEQTLRRHTWTSWSGSIQFTPERLLTPVDETALQQIVKETYHQGKTLRVVGASHSCSDIYTTKETLINMDKFTGLLGADPGAQTAVLLPNTTIEAVGEAIAPYALAMENMGHIDKQTLAGAISTGTHGAGKYLANLSSQLHGVRLISGTGAIHDFDADQHPEMMQALRVSLGSIGLFTAVKLKLLPQYRLVRKQYRASLDDCLAQLDELMELHRNFCFYWYPRRDDVTIRTWNEEDRQVPDLPFGQLYKEMRGYAKDVLPSEQTLKFNELEYSVDLRDAVPCFLEIRQRIKEKHRKDVGWRVLFRPVKGDSNWLSNGYGKSTVAAITLHQNASLPYQAYFDDVEPIFHAYGGRPHWGKKHSMRAADLEQLYPRWADFQRIRTQFDPQGIFLNEHLKTIFTHDEQQ
ncbi:FAD/FMN-containing dehydrogenase [Parapedobacter luteus]|uniref:FAD/FMN-containing dehydrogenase n=1 Tax=Parapedobacter luteus TaxID=623280 RepID=A0A1T5DEY7_9SPHI|nr:D-arabinono-1,4-lactone oxidase [Parapedobacter luteus]SKB70259.1 FAD/FMN-containing dehydrogenase [Parapedobacter luteus]